MKILALVTIVGLIGMRASAAEAGPAIESHSVVVCMDTGNTQRVVGSARTIATGIFDQAGVKIDWRRDGSACPVAEGAIKITLSDNTPSREHPSALAYAMPFEGTHVVVYYDRMRARYDRNKLPELLAFILVHEVTHILQGVSRHSPSGIMKAQWNFDDYFQIQNKALGFMDEDVDRIRVGLRWRENRRASADPTSSPITVASRR